MCIVQRRKNPDALDIWQQKKAHSEKKTKMFSFNAKAGLMICVDGARTHLLVSWSTRLATVETKRFMIRLM